MEGTLRVRPVFIVAVACALTIGLGWLVGQMALALAFAAGATFAGAVRLATSATVPAIQLTAVTSEPSEGWQEFHRELNRARRFDRPFAIVRFVGVGRGLITERRVRDQVASMSRRIDRVWLDGGDLFALLPESDAGAAETAVARARYRLGEALNDAVTAVFPANGITSGSLIACLYQGDASPVAIGALSPIPPGLAGASAPEPGGAELAETAT